jgi:hypothetical protein
MNDRRLNSEAAPAPMPHNGTSSSYGIKHILLAIAVAMNSRTFQFFPGMPLIQELWYVFCFLLLATVFPYWKFKNCWRFSRFEGYLLLLVLIVPCVSAICAWRALGQPLIFGFLAERNVALYAFIVAISFGFRYKSLRVTDVEKSLLLLSWGTMILFTTMHLALRPSDFTRYGIGFVTGPDELAEFKFQLFFVAFGFFYYVFQGFWKKSAKHYVISLAFLATAIGPVGGRGLTVSLALAALFFFCRWGGKAFLLKTLPKMLLILVSLVGILYVFEGETVSARYGKFSDAFQAVFAGTEVADASAASRPLQVLEALPHIAEHPLFGNGLVSNQWQRKQQNSLTDFYPADYVFPPDIGVIGVMYLYGVFGILLFGWQYRFAWVSDVGLGASCHSPLLDATKGFLLFSVINSIATGIFVFNSETVLLFIVLLGRISSDIRSLPGARANGLWKSRLHAPPLGIHGC